MRHTSLAALLTTAVVAGGLAATPAYARAGAEARAVWAKSRTGKDGYSRSCGRRQPRGERPYLAGWNWPSSLTVRGATRRPEEGPTTVRVLVVGPSSGSVRQKDTYKISGSAYA
ncbi:hypothetical protein [Streptosporangium sp. 'caverna']|uniref:hypothetical protein n=1 Tax=Streptosporangium sp. 'caverna' TaxID=2202249 RepID=UPI000D7E6415|nr:hypothetical protein [Streptosporangium sp. 'caverna']AWS45022.1 hypothetical protein DKM19_30620 [Streptosporangium sp. 'caverna']